MTDTICALATAPGGALGIIRVSGSSAFPILSTLLVGEVSKLHTPAVRYTHIVSAGEIIDDVILTIFRAPHSYTGEDIVEISCHGSPYILKRILDLLCQQGCRMARPGEFTMRAYLNGKMDLSQAEAVADLIASSNKATHNIAMSQLRGHFSSELAKLRDQLLKLTSLLELELDFSDHEDLEFANRAELLALAQTIEDHITRLAKSFETGQAIKQGIPVAIVGKTNVGKSTLLNALLKDDRAIVSPIHGTTRDTIEDTIDINGITFRFIDTAGIRQTVDEIEQIGIDRTYQAIDRARIILWLFDKQPTAEECAAMTERAKGRTLLPIQTKSDLSPVCCDLVTTTSPVLSISAKTGQGLSNLEAAIFNAANLPTLSDTDIIITSARHHEALNRAHTHLLRVIDGLNSNLPGDLLAEDLHLVLSDLAEITGEGQITPQETLNNIFSHFCIGK